MAIFENFALSIMSSLGINGNLAVLLLLLMIGAGLSIIQMARQGVRLKMHADHFDVLDKIQVESLRQSSKSLEQSAYTKGMLDGIFIKEGLHELIEGSGLNDSPDSQK